jgi:hypothetical protein
VTHTLSDIYLQYFKDGGMLSKSQFKNICQDFNIHIMNHIIYEAGTFRMGNNMSFIKILRLDRNFNNLVIDWNESNQLKKKLIAENKPLYNKETGEGHEWLVYHTNTYYCRFYWAKKFCRIPNKTVYRFEPTRGYKGNKEKLKEFLEKNELNYQIYQNGSL